MFVEIAGIVYNYNTKKEIAEAKSLAAAFGIGQLPVVEVIGGGEWAPTGQFIALRGNTEVQVTMTWQDQDYEAGTISL